MYCIEEIQDKNIIDTTILVCKEVLKDVDFSRRIVFIKPNAVYPHPPESGTTTDPRVIEGILEYLKKRSEYIVIAESGMDVDSDYIWLDTYIKPLVDKYGVSYSSIRELKKVKSPIFPPTVVPQLFLDEKTIIINVPKLKIHCQAWMTCAIKNFMGCFFPRYVIHRGSLNKNLEILGKYLLTRRDIYTIVDASRVSTFDAICGVPVDMNLIYGSDNLVTADSIGATLLGVDPTYFVKEKIYDPLIEAKKIKAEVFGNGILFDKS